MQMNETKKKVLVMDDEDMVGEIACQLFRYLGFDAVWVASGGEAVEEYTKQQDAGDRYSAIVMDLTVPGGMGGRETVVAILAIDPLAKVFVSSGYANDPVMLNYGEYGFVGAIAKPFDIAAIQQIFGVLS